jgi:hypothetical protein
MNLKNKKIYFSGRGEKIDKEELIKYFIQNEATIVDDVDESDIIIQGYMTSTYDEDRFYLLSKEGKGLHTIEQIEKEFSTNLDIDSILMAIKISKEKQRVINLLKNRYFSDEVFVKILKYYNWENIGIYDNDDNRDVATAITQRFCTLVETNHNIQHSPIGIYYTALETTNEKLLEIIYNMPVYSISDKNAQENQPLTLKEVVALNPNTPKPVLIQILKNNKVEELKFLAQNQSLNKLLKEKLFELNDITITKNLIIANNVELENIDTVLKNSELKIELLKHIELKEQIFSKLLSSNLSDVEYIYLSSNPTLNSNQIEQLFEKNIENANINLLKNLNCSEEKIKEFLDLKDTIYNIAIAHNENLSDAIFKDLEALNDLNINLSLAYNPSTPKEILTQLYSQNIHELNEALCQNSNTPIHILMQLQVDTRYNTLVSNNQTYKEFSKNNLGIIENNNNFKRNTYMDTI